MLVHHMTLVSFRLLRKNFGHFGEILGKWFTGLPPPRPKIALTPMPNSHPLLVRRYHHDHHQIITPLE